MNNSCVSFFNMWLAPKEMPRTLRFIGYVCGRSAGFISRAKLTMDKVAKESNLSELHHEVKQQLKEIHHIRNEIHNDIRSGIAGFPSTSDRTNLTESR